MLLWCDLVALYRLTQNIKSWNTEARYNVPPTQTVPFIRLDDEGNKVVDDGRWWLVPHWAKEIPRAAMFNARIETVYSSPAFRDAFKMRRCLIPAEGFYEWTKADDGGIDPWLIQMPGGAPYAFAGLWHTPPEWKRRSPAAPLLPHSRSRPSARSTTGCRLFLIPRSSTPG
jgi:putative SOS response-associated peptidase YedK